VFQAILLMAHNETATQTPRTPVVQVRKDELVDSDLNNKFEEGSPWSSFAAHNLVFDMSCETLVKGTPGNNPGKTRMFVSEKATLV
jgi:hypothetical protein